MSVEGGNVCEEWTVKEEKNTCSASRGGRRRIRKQETRQKNKNKTFLIMTYDTLFSL